MASEQRTDESLVRNPAYVEFRKTRDQHDKVLRDCESNNSAPQSGMKGILAKLAQMRPLSVVRASIIYGLFLLVSAFTSFREEVSDRNHNNNTNHHNNDDDSSRKDFDEKTSRYYRNRKYVSELKDPNGFLVPLCSLTCIVYFGLHASERSRASYGDVDIYRNSCPENGRRTRTAALVKLLAATITTIGINAHLGSLTGSDSWKGELWRALEVLIIPLAPLFHFGMSIYYEVMCSVFPENRVWLDDYSVRQRIVRACHCEIEKSAIDSVGIAAASVNPEHTTMVAIPRDLKWYGRVFLLTVFLSQYIQAAILITRRYQSQTVAMVDFAILLMVIAGLVALMQSLTILILSTKWSLREDFEPCAERTCRFQKCIDYKKKLNLPTMNYDLKLFGHNVGGIPRLLLHTFAGGNLQYFYLVVDIKKYPLYVLLWQCHNLCIIWKSSVHFVLHLDGVKSFLTSQEVATKLPATRTEKSASPSSSEKDRTVSVSGSSPHDRPSSNSDPSSEPVSSSMGGWSPSKGTTYSIVGFMIGVLSAIFGVLSIGLCLVYIFWPFIHMYRKIAIETLSWDSWDAGKPCPQLWKDDLEDRLWWF